MTPQGSQAFGLRMSEPLTLTRPHGPRPVILLVDDDATFLHISEEQWKEYYPDHAELHTLNPHGGEDPVVWIRNRLEKKERLDAIFLDERIPGKNGFAILKKIQDHIEQARYVPVVVMTAYPEQSSNAEALEKGALRYISKHQGQDRPGRFFFDLLLMLPQLREQVEDAMWIALLRDIDTLSVDKNLNDVVDMAAQFLAEHFGNSIIYVREHAEEKLCLLGGQDRLGAGVEINSDAVPYLAKLLTPQGDSVIRTESIAVEDAGKEPWSMNLRGLRLLAVPLIQGASRVGTVALYRQPERHPFRHKDETFLQHFALKIAAFLSEERALKQLQQRRTQLAEFAQRISNARDEQEACKSLASLLHKEVQRADNNRAKTTIRLLQPGKPTIPRICIEGLRPPSVDDPSVDDLVRNIYQTTESVYARVIRHRCTESHDNIPEECKDGGFLETYPGVQSSLTVPLLSAGLCLGAVNMEYLSLHYYTREDREFSEAVAGLTANTLVRLKAQRFLKGLLELVNDLMDPTPTPTEKLSCVTDHTLYSPRVVHLNTRN